MRRLWDRLASIDPLWAILSDPEKAGRKWRLDEFMESGDREVSLLLYDLKALDAAPALGSALDFGCGIGRLSQAFGRRFASVLGVDISERMIALASRINAYLEVQYRCIPDGTLQGIAGTHFDLIYSNIVLQHIPPDIAEQRIVEFCALLAAGGILVFYVPSHPTVDVAPVSRPMPASAYRASIHVVGSLPMTVRPGEQLSVAATVGNESEIDWQPHAVGSIQLGNHWLDQEASMLIQDDGRSPVSDPLGAGRTSHMTLAVRRASRRRSVLARTGSRPRRSHLVLRPGF